MAFSNKMAPPDLDLDVLQVLDSAGETDLLKPPFEVNEWEAQSPNALTFFCDLFFHSVEVDNKEPSSKSLYSTTKAKVAVFFQQKRMKKHGLMSEMLQ